MSCACGSGPPPGGGDRCGCCEGTIAITPRDVFNRPALPALRRRIGDHHDFLETMRAAIATVGVEYETGELDAHGLAVRARRYPLRALRTREPEDPTIAVLDLWAIVGDILTFYTERIVQEGYLRTATELRSVSELARLVGYRRRPGVAASAYLAFTVDDTYTTPVVVPAGARAQSLPGPGEMPQFFETGASLEARAAFNELRPRSRRPVYLPRDKADTVPTLWFAGTGLRLDPNTPLLSVYGDGAGQQVLRFVDDGVEDFDAGTTAADLRLLRRRLKLREPAEVVGLDDIIATLERPPTQPPSAPARLTLTPRQAFGPGSAAVDGLIERFHPAAAELLGAARATAPLTPDPDLQAVYAMRVKASIYGHLALPPQKTGAQPNADGVDDADWSYAEPEVAHPEKTIDLDQVYDAIVPASWVVIVRPALPRERKQHPNVTRVTLITRVADVETVSRTDYDTPAKVTRLTLAKQWLAEPRVSLRELRSTIVYAAPQELTLAAIPIEDPVCGGQIELDGHVDGLAPGRWLVVSGERAVSHDGEEGHDVFAATGVMVSEIAMLADVRQEVLQVVDGEVVPPSAAVAPTGIVAPQAGDGKPRPLPGDRVHTFLELATPLSYCYVRAGCKIFANVELATHGETKAEPLGSGDPAKALQRFALKSKPLTYVPSPTPSGIESTLQVYVDDVRWHEAEDLVALGPADHGYVTFADHTEETSITFGDGRTGARLTAGVENIRAVYRAGIGRPGNVRAGQLSLLITQVQGLRAVVNPQRASGGADPEGIESTRVRAPLAVSALDRLVSIEDYAEFALTFAGIGKAAAARLPSRAGSIVHVTVAGVDDAPIDPGSLLATSLLEALQRYGDPRVGVVVAARELHALVVAARVKLDVDHVWEAVRPQLEAALAARFGFDARDLAQDAYAAEALAAMQGVAGVDYVDLDAFTAVAESATTDELANLADRFSGPHAVRERVPARAARPRQPPRPAQLVALAADAPSTVLLSEIPT